MRISGEIRMWGMRCGAKWIWVKLNIFSATPQKGGNDVCALKITKLCLSTNGHPKTLHTGQNQTIFLQLCVLVGDSRVTKPSVFTFRQEHSCRNITSWKYPALATEREATASQSNLTANRRQAARRDSQSALATGQPPPGAARPAKHHRLRAHRAKCDRNVASWSLSSGSNGAHCLMGRCFYLSPWLTGLAYTPWAIAPIVFF